jgi:hypothetical protein
MAQQGKYFKRKLMMEIEYSTTSDSTLKDFSLSSSRLVRITEYTQYSPGCDVKILYRSNEKWGQKDLSTGQGEKRHWIFCRPIDIDATYARKIGSCGTSSDAISE